MFFSSSKYYVMTGVLLKILCTVRKDYFVSNSYVTSLPFWHLPKCFWHEYKNGAAVAFGTLNYPISFSILARRYLSFMLYYLSLRPSFIITPLRKISFAFSRYFEKLPKNESLSSKLHPLPLEHATIIYI